MTSSHLLSYGRQNIDEVDVESVREVLVSDWLTTGPAVDRFEAALAKRVQSKHAVVCNSGTAALYLAARATNLQEGDVVVVPAITFVASASANILAGLDVIFADVNPDTGLMEVAHAAAAVKRAGQKKVKAFLPVHLGGRVADPAALQSFAREHGAIVIEDACHALGTTYADDTSVGACHDSVAACFSFHPVKTIAMGEGGALTTNSDEIAHRARLLRNHGMERNAETVQHPDMAFAEDGALNPWYYEVSEISHNFRASDINCALGLSQLKKLDGFLARRKALMARYADRLAPVSPHVRLIVAAHGVDPGWHICSVLIDFDHIDMTRRDLMSGLHARGIGSQVHYIPVNKQPFYQRRNGDEELPGAWSYYCRTLTLPLSSAMTEADVDYIVDALANVITR